MLYCGYKVGVRDDNDEVYGALIPSMRIVEDVRLDDLRVGDSITVEDI